MQKFVEAMKQLTRPVTTLLLVATYCVAAMLSDDPVAVMKEVTLPVITFYFVSREKTKQAG